MGITMPEAIEKAKEAGYSDQDIHKAVGQPGSSPTVEADNEREEKKNKESTEGVRSFRSSSHPIFDSYDIIRTPKRMVFSIPPFGYEIFGSASSSFEPLDYGPADPDYQIGPGDELAVSLYGDVQISSVYRVDREGKISIPEAGIVVVNGMTLAEASKKITDRLSLSYSGIKNRTVSVDITLGKLKRIKIFIMGEVVQPGGYTVSSTSTAFTALYYAAGPTNQGSLRNIQVLRNNKLLARIDLYDLLLWGRKDSDVRLQNGDVVFVPLAPQKVAIARGVYRPGIYELLPGEGLKALLSLSGGVRPDAFGDLIQINRTDENGLARLLDLPYELVTASVDEFPLENEDVLLIQKVPEGIDNIVEISGNVLIPGSYQLGDSMSLGALIARAGGLLKTAYKPKAEVSRMLFFAKPESIVTFCLNLDSDEGLGFLLRNRDKVIIRQDPDYQPQKKVRVEGMVRVPGEYSLLGGQERLSSVISRAGGLRPLAYPEGVIFTRAAKGQIDVNLNSALKKRGGLDDLVMVDGDQVLIPERPATVAVLGEVFFPVNTIYESNRGYKHYLEKVGGTTEMADKKRITVRLPNGRSMRPKTFFGMVQRNIPPGSTIIVPRRRETKEIKWGDVLEKTTAIISATAVTILAIQQIK